MSTSAQGAKPSGGVSSRALFAIGLIAALTYIIGMWAKFPNGVQLVTKAIPLVCMLVWLWTTVPRDRFANTIMAGLAVSLVADLVMQWDKSMFLPGLVIFLVAQIIYIVAFVGVTKRGQLGAPAALCSVGRRRFSDPKSLPARSNTAGGSVHHCDYHDDVARGSDGGRARQDTRLRIGGHAGRDLVRLE